MRHNKKINHLGRKAEHRHAMLANMASSLILHKRITTTLAKAKALRVYVEPLITKSKADSTHSRRTVFSYLGNKEAVTELFREISQKIADRPGGYTRILKTGKRLGDNAEMCIIELVDYNLLMLGEKDQKSSQKSSSRRRRGTGATKKATDKPVAATQADSKTTTEDSVSTETEEIVTDTQVVEPVDQVVEQEIIDEAQPETNGLAEEPGSEQEKADDTEK